MARLVRPNPNGVDASVGLTFWPLEHFVLPGKRVCASIVTHGIEFAQIETSQNTEFLTAQVNAVLGDSHVEAVRAARWARS